MSGLSLSRITAWSVPEFFGPTWAARGLPALPRAVSGLTARTARPRTFSGSRSIPARVMTYVLELRGDKLNQLYLWEPEAYKDKVN